MVTIQRSGNFSLNKAAYDLLGSPEAVELLFDRERQLVGFRKTDPDNPRAFGLRAQGKNAVSFMIAGRAFTRHYGIDTTAARRYPVQMQDDILVLDLKGEFADVSAPRGKKDDAGGE
ncbi:MAG: hypothetical protein K6T51_10995 [Rubrobacteraceae bacterium]|nr:hypothetical protein [Rubrobacteraceae bacterium]MCL6439128.1 hypothetical protein [Rubrobacteraceae bacterium]